MKKALYYLLALTMIFSVFIADYPVQAAESDIALTVRGDGVNKVTTFTLAALQALPQETHTYSIYNTFPTWERRTVTGPTLAAVLAAAGLKTEATAIKVTASDGLTATFTKEQLLSENRCYFPYGQDGSANGAIGGNQDGKMLVPAMLDLSANNGTLIYGQLVPNEQTEMFFVKYLCNGGLIEVVTTPVGQWQVPMANPVAGSVADGTLVTLTKQDLNRIKVYYTTDNTVPTIASNMANISDWQANLSNVPIKINQPTVIKAIVIGFGKNPSNVATFNYTLQNESGDPSNPAKILLTSPVAGNGYTCGTRLQINGQATGLADVSVVVKDSKDNLLFVGQPMVVHGAFSTSFTLPVVTKAENLTVVVGGDGIRNKATCLFGLQPNTTGGGGTGGGGGTPPDDGAIVLTIEGHGVAAKKEYTLKDLEAMSPQLYSYSTINTFPTRGLYDTKALPLAKILNDAGLQAPATSIRVESHDGYVQQFTREELLNDTRYYYPQINSGSAAGKQVVPTVITLQFGEGTLSGFDMRLCVGQRNFTEQNMPWFVQDVSKITVSTEPLQQWEKAGVSQVAGKVAKGTAVELEHRNFDNVKIYYTIDGSTPTINSTMYNISRTSWQPQLNKPIIIDKPMTIKAVVVGAGKQNSDIMEFKYDIDASLPTVSAPVSAPGVTVSNLLLAATVKDGKATARVNDAELTKLIRNAENSWQANAANKVKLKVEIVGLEGANSLKLDLAKASLDTIIKSSVSQVLLQTSLGDILIDKKSLEDIAKKAGTNIYFQITKVEAPLTKDQNTLKIRGQRPLYGFSISTNTTNDSEEQIPQVSGQLRFSLPYTLLEGETAESLIVYSWHQNGQITILKNSQYNKATKQIEFLTTALSVYGVGLNQQSFADVKNHWAKSVIEFLSARNIITGVGNNLFNPNGTITRAEFVKMLAETIDGINLPPTAKLEFKDIQSGDWYAKYIAWAVANGIVKGYGNGTFGPNDPVLREEAASILVNFAKAVHLELFDQVSKKEFTDDSAISKWALSNVYKMQTTGVMNGKDTHNFDPQGLTTRAEAAKMVVELFNSRW